MERLKLRHLQLLDQIMRCGSLSAAALSMGMSQPGATKLLHELELALGKPLVDRSPRGGRLTRSGERVLERFRVALGALSTAQTVVHQAQDRPLVRLGILPLVGIDALAQVVADLQARGDLPRLVIRTGTVEGLLSLLAQGEVDAVVGGLDGEWAPQHLQQLDVRPLWTNQLVAICAKRHPLAKRTAVHRTELQNSEWVLMPHGSTSRRAFDDAFLTAGLAPPPATIECESFHMGLSLVANTSLLAVVPKAAYLQHRSRVHCIALSEPFLSNAIVWMTLRGIPVMPAVQTMAQAFEVHARA